MIISVTGHRPEKIKISETELYNLLSHNISEAKPEAVIVGMAAGVDLIAGKVALDLNIDVVAAVPWMGHSPRIKDEELYQKIKDLAANVIYISDSIEYPGAYIYQMRNKFMVDNSTHLLAYYDGTGGGTGNCIKYARGRIPIRNIYGKTISV